MIVRNFGFLRASGGYRTCPLEANAPPAEIELKSHPQKGNQAAERRPEEPADNQPEDDEKGE